MDTKFFVLTLGLFSFEIFAAASVSKQIVAGETKRLAAVKTILYDSTQLPVDLINIISEYDQGKVVVNVQYPITAFAILPDGRIVSAGKDDGSIQIWKLDGSLDKELIEHTYRVHALLMVPPTTLVTGGDDQRIKLWNLDTGTCTKSFLMRREIRAIIPLYDSLIAVGSLGRGIRIVNLQTQQLGDCFVAKKGCVDRLHDIFALAFLPRRKEIFSGGYRAYIKRWDLTYPATHTTFTYDSGLITSFAECADIMFRRWVNALVVLPDETVASAWSSGDIKIFDPVTEKRVKLLEGHKDEVRSLLLLTPTILISASDDHTIKVWDLAKHKDQCIATLVGHTQPVVQLIKVDDTTFLSASWDGTVRKWTWPIG